MSVIVIVADGARPEAVAEGIAAGRLPALARLAAEGFHGRVTTVFPSVTGLAYVPMTMGRHPVAVGLPGLRWLDRARDRTRSPHFTRSYLGWDMRHLSGDLDATAPTIFELSRPSFAALSMIGRGLATRDWIGRSLAWQLRGAWAHFRGSVDGWLAIDRQVADLSVRRIARDHPSYAMVALLGIDKLSHAFGCTDPRVDMALALVDDTVARIRADAERDGRWADMHLWVVSDHGHSPVHTHDDLADIIRNAGHRTIAHPRVRASMTSDVAVMVSGNAMAHLYLEPQRRQAAGWAAHAARWEPLVHDLVSRPSADLVILPVDETTCEVRSARCGSAQVSSAGALITYTPTDGDPLQLGTQPLRLSHEASWERCAETDYPDALVQIAHLADAPRVGDIILSAAPGWDFRARFEPIPHRSTHGSLHRDHMWVPLLGNRPVTRPPQRTVDLFPSTLTALGLPPVAGSDGETFVAAG